VAMLPPGIILLWSALISICSPSVNILSIPKAGVFAEAQAKAVSQQIIDDIENNTNKLSSSSSRFDGKGFCFMEVGDKKAGYVAADFYNEQGHTTLLEPPSGESYKKKIDFEKGRLNEWLL
jgi:sulfide:quinone oxidoreductase